MDFHNVKLSKIREKYDKFKKRIWDWEKAVYKTEGRKPTRDDMKQAPRDIQDSYKNLVRLKKYLEELSKREESQPRVATTPGKLFIPRTKLKFNRSDYDNDRDRDKDNHREKTKKRPSAFNKLFKAALEEPVRKKEDEKKKVVEEEEKQNKTQSEELKDFGVDDKKSEPVSIRALKSPKAKGLGISTSKKLDIGWLSRLVMDEESMTSNSSLNLDKESQVQDDSEPVAMDEETQDVVVPPPADEQFQDALVDAGMGKENEGVDVDFRNANLPVESSRPQGPYLTLNEDLDEYTEVQEFTVPKLIEILDQEIQNDSMSMEMDESIQDVSVNVTDEEMEYTGNRKRSASFAFSPSPSPEKEMPKRKFFKSSRTDRTSKFQYSKTSYRVPTPEKRITRSSKPPPEPLKLKLSRVTTDDRNSSSSNQDVWSSKIQSPEQGSPDERSHDNYEKSKVKSKPEKKKATTKKTGKGTPTGRGKVRAAKKKAEYKDSDEEDDPAEGTDKQKQSGTNVVVDIFDEAQATMPSGGKRKVGRKFGKRKQESLESKIQSGKVDENFVRIDLKRKVFVRGHKKMSVVKMKRLEWKNRKMMQTQEKSLSNFTCHKCGEKGHYSKFCTKDLANEESAPPGEEDDCPLPTLEEAARMVFKNAGNRPGVNRVNLFQSSSQGQIQGPTEGNGEPGSEDVLCAEEPEFTVPKLIETLDPFFNEETDMTDLDEEMNEGLKQFGYSSFRPGQKEAISRVLQGLSTLLILSTGSGKSLCYQLPAYLYGKKYPGALTLCVSPLVSLMEDQVQGIPQFLSAACLHSNMTTKQKTAVLDKVKSRKLNILLVSPEAICGGLFGLLKGSTDTLPKISFACIDEVHCVSQWSHNFRPSYLQLCKILREKLNVRTILGLTATSTKTTSISICEHLNIDPSTTIRGELIPRNLKLSVSRDVYKDEALINLLQGTRFKDCDSIIIYCTRREECERIATLVRTKLQTIQLNKIIRTKSRARLSGNCEAYHAGMTARRRKNVQEGFMSGDIRIVVATVAFGMGIDKSDIRAVIHYNMPSAFESYVQEIGRAGRDGLPAHCHLFLDNAKRSDLNELKRHVYANSVDRPTIRRLLRKVFKNCKCKRIEKLRGNVNPSNKSVSDGDSSLQKPCEGHEVSFAIEKCVTDLDLPKENITTLLCYLELDENKWIEMLPLTYEKCKIQSYGGAKLLRNAASRCPPLAVAIALLQERGQFHESDPYIEFNVIDIAATVGWSSSVVKKELKQLEWSGSQFDEKGNPTRFRKSGLLVEFSELAYRVKSRGSLSDEEADKVLNTLHNRNVQQEQTQIYQLHRVYEALMSVSFPSIINLCDSYDEEKSNQLKNFIYEYFSEDSITIPGELPISTDTNIESEKVEELRRTIRNLVFSNRDTPFTTRAIARILQGIGSPCFPADVWYRNREFWRKFLDLDFHFICRIAAECI